MVLFNYKFLLKKIINYATFWHIYWFIIVEIDDKINNSQEFKDIKIHNLVLFG